MASAPGVQAQRASISGPGIVLGLGLGGLVGSASVLGLRRRRAEANATGRSKTN